MTDRICQCGKPIKANLGRGRPRKFCTSCSPRRVPTEKAVQLIAPHPCRVCRVLIETRSNVCSEQCRWKLRRRKPCVCCGKPSGYSASDTRGGDECLCRPCRRALRPQEPASLTNWTCLNCGKFCTRTPVRGQVPKYCGTRCQQLASFHRRRARLQNAFVEDVNRLEVFLADGYKCHLCGSVTDKTKAYPHPKSPTIDHIIPIAKGGLHEQSNCRTACAQCNWAKQDRGGGEQFALLL